MNPCRKSGLIVGGETAVASRLLVLAAFMFAIAAVAAGPASGAPTVRAVAEGANIDWSFEHGPNPARYRVGDVTLTLRGRRDRASRDLIVPVLTVAMRGLAPAQTEGAATTASFEHRVTVGRWDAARPYVLFQSYSGGAHCCNEVHVVYPDGGRLRVVDLGEYDGDYLDTLPTDRNGDGRLDFVFADNSFLYAFASYAESWAPPQVINVIDGRAVDVSADPSLRPVYAAEMARERQACVYPEDGLTPNGACAAYVASAARVGRFDTAWAEMLGAYDRHSDWTLPTGCRVALVDHQCPQGQAIEYGNYPVALRAFLIEQGYIAR